MLRSFLGFDSEPSKCRGCEIDTTEHQYAKNNSNPIHLYKLHSHEERRNLNDTSPNMTPYKGIEKYTVSKETINPNQETDKRENETDGEVRIDIFLYKSPNKINIENIISLMIFIIMYLYKFIVQLKLFFRNKLDIQEGQM